MCVKSAKRARCRISIRSRSEEHTSELQSQSNLVCRLLLEKKNHLAEQTAPAAHHDGAPARVAQHGAAHLQAAAVDLHRPAAGTTSDAQDLAVEERDLCFPA